MLQEYVIILGGLLLLAGDDPRSEHLKKVEELVLEQVRVAFALAFRCLLPHFGCACWQPDEVVRDDEL